MPELDEQSVKNLRSRIGEAFRQIASDQVTQFVHCSQPIIKEIEDYTAGQVLGNEMILVSLSGPTIQLLFKIHFSHSQAISRLTTPPETSNSLPTDKDIDFMKELGNQVCGAISRQLSKLDIILGLSVPLCTRGYYEIYSDYTERTTPFLKIADSWALQGSFGDLYFSSYIEVMDDNSLPVLASITAGAPPSEDIDFL